jgi:4'-phosphopantetheinyl transferase
MEVFWLEQRQADVPGDDVWLGPGERERLATLRVPKRREDWRLGRWTAKHAVAAYLGLAADVPSLAAIEIRPADSGAPEIFLAEQPGPVSISITHREGRAVCAAGPNTAAIGCDLELIEPRSEAFVSDYFTSREQELVAQSVQDDRFVTAALLWSAKESTLKALREGLRIDTRQVEVELQRDAAGCASTDGWHPLLTSYEQQPFHGWWRRDGEFVLTLISEPASSPPTRLSIAL